jgi:CHAT domain-containing protein
MQLNDAHQPEQGVAIPPTLMDDGGNHAESVLLPLPAQAHAGGGRGSTTHVGPSAASIRKWGARSSIVVLLPLIILFRVQDTRAGGAQTAYSYDRQLLVRGQLAQCQLEAELGYQRYRLVDLDWAAKFRLLEAEVMLWRGLSDGTMNILSQLPAPSQRDNLVKALALEGAVLTRRQLFPDADRKLKEAEDLCSRRALPSCGEVIRARGVFALNRGEPLAAREWFLKSLSFSRLHDDPILETTALVNLAAVALQTDHYDEAADWSKAANRLALGLGAEYFAEAAAGNLGWAYFQLGDRDNALVLFLDAEKHAVELGDLRFEIRWLENIGYVYLSDGEAERATPVYSQALDLAKRIDSKSDIVTILENLAFATIETRQIDEASSYLDQTDPLIRASASHRDELWVELARGLVAAQRGQGKQSETLLRAVQQDPESQTSLRLEAGHQLALLEESQRRATDAEKSYKSTLATFEQARDQLKKEDSRLPFLANATAIYDDYVHFLVQQGRPLEALALADQSRARTLEEGLGFGAGKASLKTAAFDPRSVAAKTQSTLLFYWLGEKQSYLWAVTPTKVTLFNLPPRQQIAARVESYHKALLDLRDPLVSSNPDGQALYQMLVSPAATMIRPNKPVIVLDEGVLSRLNFETLLAPGPGTATKAPSNSNASLHYLIDDFTLSSAPSIAMLAAARAPASGQERMLLLGDPISPNRDFPSLGMFGAEMSRIESRFPPKQLSVFTGPGATPAAYAASHPEQFSYIHFVSHAIANSTSPLDSAIILSNSTGQQDAYKLYAREIIQHPIDARLVTISACYGSGTRAYSGEGLVGLSWAFLRAGAHKVIGALWEVSDESTPRLMDSLYQGLAAGEAPALALHNAKLALVHSPTRFRVPFYWAPFQIYSRQ